MVIKDLDWTFCSIPPQGEWRAFGARYMYYIVPHFASINTVTWIIKVGDSQIFQPEDDLEVAKSLANENNKIHVKRILENWVIS